jgi:hypothetical protein
LTLPLARTLPFVWNPVTCCYFEAHGANLALDCLGLLLLARFVEPFFGRRETLKIIFIVNASSGVTAFCSLIVAFFLTRHEALLYAKFLQHYLAPLSYPTCLHNLLPNACPRYRKVFGFQGATAALLVALKYQMPDQDVSLLYHAFNIKAKARSAPASTLLNPSSNACPLPLSQWLPSLFTAAVLCVAPFSPVAQNIALLWTLGTYIAWLYLRHLKASSVKAVSEDFELASFFPGILRSVVAPVSSAAFRLVFGRREAEKRAENGLSGSAGDAARRQQRGARALEERLRKAEKGALLTALYCDGSTKFGEVDVRMSGVSLVRAEEEDEAIETAGDGFSNGEAGISSEGAGGKGPEETV